MDPKIDTKKTWEDFFDRTKMRDSLSKIAFYLLCFETLKGSIIDRLKSFYSFEFKNGVLVPDKRYTENVLKKNKSVLYASIAWLKEMNAISDNDIEKFEEIKILRNRIAHESENILRGEIVICENDFEKIKTLLEKIELWWIVNVEIPTNPDLSDKIILDSDIHPGNSLLLSMIQAIAFENKDL